MSMSYKAWPEAKMIKLQNKRKQELFSLFNGLSFEDPRYIHLIKVFLLEDQPFFFRASKKSLFIDGPENSNTLRSHYKTNLIQNRYASPTLENNIIGNNSPFDNKNLNQEVEGKSDNKFPQSEKENQSHIKRFHRLADETAENTVSGSIKSYNLRRPYAEVLNYSELIYFLEFINNVINFVLDKKRLLQLDFINNLKEASSYFPIDLEVEKKLEFFVNRVNKLSHSFNRKTNQAIADLSPTYRDIYEKKHLVLSLSYLNFVLSKFTNLVNVGRARLERLGRNSLQLSRKIVQKPLNLLLALNDYLLNLEDNLLISMLTFKTDLSKFINLSSKIFEIEPSLGYFSSIINQYYSGSKQQAGSLWSHGVEQTKLSYNESQQILISKVANLDQKFIHRLVVPPQMSSAISIPSQFFVLPIFSAVNIEPFARELLANLKNIELYLRFIYGNLVRIILEISSLLTNNIAGVLYNINFNIRKIIDEILSIITLKIKDLLAYKESSRFHHLDLFESIGGKINSVFLFLNNFYNNIKFLKDIILNEVVLLQNVYMNNLQFLVLSGLGYTQDRYRAHKPFLLTAVGISALSSIGLIYNSGKQNQNSDVFASYAYGLYSKLSSSLKANNSASINRIATNKFTSLSVHLGKSFYSQISKDELDRHYELHQNKSTTLVSASRLNSFIFDKSEINNDTQSLYQTALRYLNRKEEVYDPSLGAKIINKLAEQQFPPAQFCLGKLYEAGIGVPRDQTLALKWYKLAAEAGLINAMHNSAVILLNSKEKRNISEALRWFKQAANLGLKDSQYNLGLIYAKGLSVKQDFIQSYKWLYLAVLQGDKEAKNLQEEVGRKLSLEEIDQARELAVDIKKTN